MNTLAIEKREAAEKTVSVTEDTLTVHLADGRTLSVPLAWYPRLLHGSSKERSRWRLIGKGEGIHWADLDEDIRVESLLFGHPSKRKSEVVQALAGGSENPRSVFLPNAERNKNWCGSIAEIGYEVSRRTILG